MSMSCDQRRDHLPRQRSLHGDHRPLLGDRGQPHAKFGKFGLPIVFHMVQHAGGAAGRRGDVEAIRRQAGDDAIIHHEACLVQQHAVAAAARREPGEAAGVEAVEEFRRIRPDHLDLAQRGGVEHADRVAHGAAFARDGRVHVLAVAREIARALPGADILEHRALRRGPIVDRRPAHRLEQIAARGAGERAERHRRIGHAEGGVADLRHRLVQSGRRPIASAFMLDCLALVGRHAGRGVALDMLDRAKAFAAWRWRRSLAVTSFWKSTKALPLAVAGCATAEDGEQACVPATDESPLRDRRRA